MILGIIIGIIGIIFSSEIDGFMRHDKINNSNLVEQYVRFFKMTDRRHHLVYFSTMMKNSYWEWMEDWPYLWV